MTSKPDIKSKPKADKRVKPAKKDIPDLRPSTKADDVRGGGKKKGNVEF